MENKITQTFKNNKLLQNIDSSKLNFKDIKGKLVTLKEGEILFREGEVSESIFLIVSGEIKIYERDENEIKNSLIITGGEFFGHLDFYETSIRHTNAVGVKDSYLIAVSKAEMNNLLWQDVNILQNLKNLCSFKSEEPESLAVSNVETQNEESLPDILENEIINEGTLKFDESSFSLEEEVVKLEDNEPSLTDINSGFSIENNFDMLNNSVYDDIEKDFDVLSNEVKDNTELNENIDLTEENLDILESKDSLELPDTSDLLEFIDDEEPENIEFKFS